jgi:lipopolysaccharide export LptBFGC system permease protein LptF
VRILDRQRYWSFFKAYVICYISLVGLFIVIDAFSNMDEFTKRADGVVETLQVMGRYYFIHQSLFFDYLCGVIGMMAAIFTVTWMQRNNEHLAILAAGVSTHRAIWPVLISSVIVSTFAIANQELVMPPNAEELAKSHDDDGQRTVHVSSRYDSRSLQISGADADRASKTVLMIDVVIPVGVFGEMKLLRGKQGTYIPPDHPTAPLKGGWLIRNATINPPLDDEALKMSRELITLVDDLTGFPPPYAPPAAKPDGQASPGDGQAAPATPAPTRPSETAFRPHSEIPYLAALPPLPLCLNPGILKVYSLLDRKVDLSRGNYFLKSSLTFQAMTRKPDWYKFATTRDLIEGLSDPSTEGTERNAVAIFVHGRILRPILGLNLLFMSLPLVLGGYGRNTFINLGLALGNTAIFYGAILFCQYLGSFPEFFGRQAAPMSAWAPLMLFGIIATIRWGQIRT